MAVSNPFTTGTRIWLHVERGLGLGVPAVVTKTFRNGDFLTTRTDKRRVRLVGKRAAEVRDDLGAVDFRCVPFDAALEKKLMAAYVRKFNRARKNQ